MHITKTTLAITAAACLVFLRTDGAERGDGSGTGSKHVNTAHRASTGGSRGGKAAPDRSRRSSSARNHTSHRTSSEGHSNRDRQRSPGNREASHVDDMTEPDANVQVELPDHEDGTESADDADNDDQTVILFGGAGDNDRPRP